MDTSNFGASWYDNDLEPYFKQEKAHMSSIESLTFNPQNANQLITGSHDHLIKVWDLEKFKNEGTLEGHSEGVWATQFSNDGKTLMSASPDKSILLWDLKKKKPQMALKEHKNKVYWASFNENSKFIASGGEDQRLIIWDLRKGTPFKIIKSDQKIIYNVQWSKCGKFLFTAEYGGIVKAFDTEKFELIDQFGKHKDTDRAWTVAMDFRENSKSGSKIFVGSEEKLLKVLNFDRKQGKFELEYAFTAHLDPIKSIQLNGPKNLFATGCRDGSCRVWEIGQTKDQQGRIKNKTVANLIGHKDNVSQLEFAPIPKGPVVLATCSWDQSFHLYKI